MSKVSWCDRKKYKKAITAWLPNEQRFSVLGVSQDTGREISDIAIWMQTKADLRVLGAFYDSDMEVRKSALLEQLARDSGQMNLFSRYVQRLNQVQQDAPNISLNFSIGNSPKAGENITFSDINQRAEVDPVKLAAASDVLKEQKIDILLDDFLTGVQEILRSEKRLLFLVSFGGQGFGSMDSTFKNWFLHSFCRISTRVDGIKVCVLNVGRIEDLAGMGADYEVEIPAHLSLEDIVDEACSHLWCFGDKGRAEEFCKGVLDFDDRVTYAYFKRKLVNRLREQMS